MRFRVPKILNIGQTLPALLHVISFVTASSSSLLSSPVVLLQQIFAFQIESNEQQFREKKEIGLHIVEAVMKMCMTRSSKQEAQSNHAADNFGAGFQYKSRTFLTSNVTPLVTSSCRTLFVLAATAVLVHGIGSETIH